jgi:predicted dehydrogenase
MRISFGGVEIMTTAPTRRDLLKAAAVVTLGRRAAQDELRLPREVRVAIIGLEGHYSEILEVAREHPAVRVTAMADGNPDLLSRAARNPILKSAKGYSDYRELLDREKLDVAAVCGQNSPRPGIVRACAEHKLAVVAEKPLAISFEELEETRKTIQACGVRLTMLMPMRFYPQYQKMKSVVQGGEIGDVVSMAAQKSYKLGERPDWVKKRDTFGGIIPWIAVHMLDLMRWTTGRELVEAAAFQSNVGFPQIGEMENNAVMIFRLDNRGTASLRMDFLRPQTAPTHGDDRLRIAGTRGVVEFQEGRGVTLVTQTQSPGQLTDLPPARHLFADFLDSLYNGREHLISHSDIYRISEILLKTRAAAEEHRIVKL